MGEPEVTVNQGTVRGFKSTAYDGSSFHSFLGIPYAQPPVGQLRFKAPLPAKKWSGVFDATKEGSPSYSRNMFRKIVVGSEDCLNLNIYTKELPRDNSSSLRPVMVWIYGGGFIIGSNSSELYGPDFLMTEDVVLVCINYRLGLLGFLSLDDPAQDVPGNAGCKDMVLALKWVQDNIRSFDGDPNNVTIFGESAGGMAVHALVLSPMARGLFHKAICQSGTALVPRAISKQNCATLATAFGLEGADETELLDHLMVLPVEELFRIQESIQDIKDANTRKFFGPVIETVKGDTAFLSEHPIDLVLSGQFSPVPFMVGYTTMEALCFKPSYQVEDTDFELHVPYQLGYARGSKESKEVANKIKQFYYGEEAPSMDNITNKIKIYSDVMFNYGIYVAAEKHAAKSKCPVYFYRMSIETSLNLFKKITSLKQPGVAHCDDLGYLFRNAWTPKIKPGSIEEISIKRFVKLWTQFASCGNPTPDGEADALLNCTWRPVDENEFHFLDIGRNLVTGSDPDRDRIAFWKGVYSATPAAAKYT